MLNSKYLNVSLLNKIPIVNVSQCFHKIFLHFRRSHYVPRRLHCALCGRHLQTYAHQRSGCDGQIGRVRKKETRTSSFIGQRTSLLHINQLDRFVNKKVTPTLPSSSAITSSRPV